MSKANKAKDLSINTLLFTISNFGTKIISFLLVPLYTYVLSTKDYGTLDLVAITVQLLVPILTLNIQDAVLRFCLDKEYNPLQVVKTGLCVAGISSVLLGLGLLAVYRLPIFKLNHMYSIYLYSLFLANVFNNILSMYLKAVNKVKLLVICGLLNTLVTCLLNILLLLVFKLGVFGYLIANISGTMFSIILMMSGSGILKTETVHIPKGLFKSMSLYSLPLIANSVAWWLNNASDRYILAFFCGTAVNGIYAVAYKIPTILSTVQSVFYNAWSISAITEFDEDDTDGFIGNVYMTYSCVSLVGCSILLIFNVYLAKILYAKEFFAAWQFVPPLLVGTVFNGIALFEGCIFTAVKNTKSVSITTILGAVVNTICNFVLIPFIGALGASIATMVGYIAIWIIRTVQMNKIVRIKAQWNSQIIGMMLLIIQCFIALFIKEFYWQLPLALLVVISHKSYLEKVLAIIKRKIKQEKL